jgi:Gluconate 2-dehydrogenase subunit 3
MNRRDLLKSSTLLLGYAVTTHSLSGCQAETPKITLNWAPVFLSNNQAQTVSDITERLLPRTQTLGAKDLNIDRFVDKMLKETLSATEQKEFLNSFNAFEYVCKNQYGATFSACSTEEQLEFVLKIDKTPVKYPPSVFGVHLGKLPPTLALKKIKEFTLLGFFTAQEIGEKVLSFDPFPGEYLACVPLANIGNAWNE